MFAVFFLRLNHLACVAGAWKKWAKERTGALACLLLARPFFLVPTTSKRLLRRLKSLNTTSFIVIRFLVKE